MGFFGKIWEGVKTVAKGAAATAGLAVLSPVWVPMLAIDKISEAMKKKSKEVATEVSKTETLTEFSSVRQVENLADVLYQYYDGYQNAAVELETQCQRIVDEYFNALAKQLETREDIAESIGMDRLKRRQRELSHKIRGSITDPIATKLSLDSAECRTILEMSNGLAKRRRMNDYANHVLHDATYNLAEKTREVLENQCDETATFLKEHIKKGEQEAERQKKLLEQWEKDMEN